MKKIFQRITLLITMFFIFFCNEDWTANNGYSKEEAKELIKERKTIEYTSGNSEFGIALNELNIKYAGTNKNGEENFEYKATLGIFNMNGKLEKVIIDKGKVLLKWHNQKWTIIKDENEGNFRKVIENNIN